MDKPRISSALPFFDEGDIAGILEDIKLTLKSGVLTNGPRVQEFERRFADYTHSKFAIAVSSASAALEIMLRFMGIEGKEVVVPTNTFVATPNAVLLAGGKPIFAEMDEGTLGIDVEDVKRRVNPKTAGVIVVHIAGLICPRMDELREFCTQKGLFLVEDDAHAQGAMIDGRMAGTLCEGGAFSFYPTKVMTTGQGGMITTDNPLMAQAAISLRDHGLDSQRIMIKWLGNNWSLSEIAAVIGTHQLSKIEEIIKARNQVAQSYQEKLGKVKFVSVFETPKNIRHSYYKYPISLSDDVNRDKVAAIMKNEFGIETGSVYYPPCHLHPYYRENFGTREGDFPVAERVLKQVLCLPVHLGITREIANYVVSSLEKSLNQV